MTFDVPWQLLHVPIPKSLHVGPLRKGLYRERHSFRSFETQHTLMIGAMLQRLQASSQVKFFKCGSPPRHSLVATAQVKDSEVPRRAILLSSGGICVTLLAPKRASSVGKTQTTDVGSYLPKAEEGYVQFKPNDTQTPAIRAGVIKSRDAYTFLLPSSWSEQKIANIQSGNFCMPRCDEPWQEVVFADASEGKATLYVLNLRRLTNKAGASIEQVGTPTGILQSVGPFITGTYLEEDDVLSADKISKNGRTYYSYEANSLSGNNGPHYLSVATTKNELVYLFTLAASDSQWKKAQSKLKKVVQSFSV